jgi:hypothetical protein
MSAVVAFPLARRISRSTKHIREIHAVPQLKPLEFQEPPVLAVGLPHIQNIADAVSRTLLISVVDILSDRRFPDIVLARHVTFFLCVKMTLWGTPTIGRLLGNKDHVTVAHGARRIDLRMRLDPALAKTVATAERLARQLALRPAEQPMTG